MADQQTLDSSTLPQSDELSHSHSTTSASSSSSSSFSDPSLVRSLSSSRLNAGAPEFVPGRTTPPLQSPRMIIPFPLPHDMLHMYHHQPPFNVSVLDPVPDLVVKKSNQREQKKSDQATETGASVSIDPKTGLVSTDPKTGLPEESYGNFYTGAAIKDFSGKL